MFLYRGLTKKTSDRMIRKKPRKLRHPKDTEPELQKLVDKLFQEKFGWKPRAQGVFATSDFYTAREYSGDWKTVHIIFPFDGFEYIWSPKIDDLYSTVLSDFDMATEYRLEREYGPESGKGYWKKGKETVEELELLPYYWDEYDDRAWSDESEKYEYGKVVTFSDDDGVTTWEEKWIWIPEISQKEYNIKYLEKKLKTYKNTNFAAAIKSGHEIMMLCRFYYAIPVQDRVRPTRFIGLYD